MGAGRVRSGVSKAWELKGDAGRHYIRLHSDENPYGCSLDVQDALASTDLYHLPADLMCTDLRVALGEYTGFRARKNRGRRGHRRVGQNGFFTHSLTRATQLLPAHRLCLSLRRARCEPG